MSGVPLETVGGEDFEMPQAEWSLHFSFSNHEFFHLPNPSLNSLNC
jgi:hypothetical protein